MGRGEVQLMNDDGIEWLKRSPSCSFSRADSQGSGGGTSTSSFGSKNSSTLGCLSIFFHFLYAELNRI